MEDTGTKPGRVSLRVGVGMDGAERCGGVKMETTVLEQQ